MIPYISTARSTNPTLAFLANFCHGVTSLQPRRAPNATHIIDLVVPHVVSGLEESGSKAWLSGFRRGSMGAGVDGWADWLRGRIWAWLYFIQEKKWWLFSLPVSFLFDSRRVSVFLSHLSKLPSIAKSFHLTVSSRSDRSLHLFISLNDVLIPLFILPPSPPPLHFPFSNNSPGKSDPLRRLILQATQHSRP